MDDAGWEAGAWIYETGKQLGRVSELRKVR
jgi:hypothetical protein